MIVYVDYCKAYILFLFVPCVFSSYFNRYYFCCCNFMLKNEYLYLSMCKWVLIVVLNKQIYLLCDCTTGITLDFNVYTGKGTNHVDCPRVFHQKSFSHFCSHTLAKTM